MSVSAGRALLGAMLGLLVISVSACVAIWHGLGPWPNALPLFAAVALLSLVTLLIAAAMFTGFVEASIDDDCITITRVLTPKQIVRLSDIDEVVLLRRLLLPSHQGGSRTLRVVLRQDGATITAFTPNREAILMDWEAHGFVPVIVDEPLTPFGAAKRYPKSVSTVERSMPVAPWIAIIAPVIVVGWLLVRLN